MELKKLETAAQLINKHFLPEEFNVELKPKDFEDFDSLINWLSSFISYLLDKDMNKLMQIMYRIDIDEGRFQRIIAQNSIENISSLLAHEVLIREIEKAESRLKYKEEGFDPPLYI